MKPKRLSREARRRLVSAPIIIRSYGGRTFGGNSKANSFAGTIPVEGHRVKHHSVNTFDDSLADAMLKRDEQ